MSFEQEYNKFIEEHCSLRTGERLRRLQEGHGHAEKLFIERVWWPAFGQFRFLNPEYEVYDFKDGYRYLDFAYIRPHVRLAIEIDGYGLHLRNQSRWQFSDQCQRQNHLIIDGWSILRFTYDDINERPRLCQQMIQQFIGATLGEDHHQQGTNYLEKEVIQLARRLCRPLKPNDLCTHLDVESKLARRILQNLVKKHWLKPASGSARIRSYSLDHERMR